MGPLPTRPGAYRWWYLDALSRDGRDGIVVIFFCGSVFSPYYARRLRQGAEPNPVEHAAVHVALYRDGRRTAWLLAEHDRAIALGDGGRSLAIGRSRWREAPGGAIEIEVDDRAPFRLAGRVRVEPLEPPLTESPLLLAPGVADHTWHARAPRARVEANFEKPGLRFEGEGYHDTNAGSEPLERALRGWTWARVHGAGGGTRVVYDVTARDGTRFGHALATGEPPALSRAKRARVAVSRTGWGIDVPAAIPVGGADARRGALLDDTPFYARYLLDAGAGRGVGETLDLTRFDLGVVRWMLRWRTWRRGGADAPFASVAPGGAR